MIIIFEDLSCFVKSNWTSSTPASPVEAISQMIPLLFDVFDVAMWIDVGIYELR